MDVTTILAVLGLVSGLTGTLIAVLSYRRDRPVIVVTSSLLLRGPGDEYLVVNVRNEGRHGAEIVGIGLAVCPSERTGLGWLFRHLPGLSRRRTVRRLDRSGVRYNDLAVVIDDDGDEHDECFFLEPGRQLSRHLSMASAAGQARAGSQAWPYAEDYAGRTYLAAEPATVTPR